MCGNGVLMTNSNQQQKHTYKHTFLSCSSSPHISHTACLRLSPRLVYSAASKHRRMQRADLKALITNQNKSSSPYLLGALARYLPRLILPLGYLILRKVAQLKCVVLAVSSNSKQLCPRQGGNDGLKQVVAGECSLAS